MGRVPGEVRQRTGDVLRSPLFRFGMLAAVAATFFVPALSFLLVGGLLAGVAYAARPLLPGRFSFPRLSFGGGDTRSVTKPGSEGNRRVSRSAVTLSGKKHSPVAEQPGRSSDTPRNKVPKGRKVGDPMVDQLIRKMTGAGLVVSTDWGFARKVLNELPEKYDFFRQNHKKVYGFVYNGVIYINPKAKAVATPIHEYTHVWAEVLRQKNPDEWKHIVDMLKNDEEVGAGNGRLWDAIKKSYPHLETDDEIADEVLATYSGKHGAALLREHYGKGMDPESVFKSVEDALRRFWNDVCSFFGVHYPDKENVADKVLADFLQGVNPLDYAEEGREKLSDRFPLHEINPIVDNENSEGMKQDNEVKILTGDEARKVVKEILANEPKPGDYVNKEAVYPVHLGAVGYFRDTTGDGKNAYSAFDNSTGDCWCEDFRTEEGARKWCSGELSTDEVRKMESNVDEIILSKDSFEEFLGGRTGDTPNKMPPFVKFDEQGEMALDMQFFDGYAIDTNPHGLGLYDRIALYYPTVAEVAKDPEMQEEIEDYTDRRWAEGSRHEQIFDIALKFGEAGRVMCPKERFDDAVDAIVERAADRRAKSFTESQRGRITLAADCNGCRDNQEMRATFFESLFSHAQEKMDGVRIAWANDAHSELQDFAKGEIRQSGGLRR